MRKKLYTERLDLSVTPRQKELMEKEAKKQDLTINQLVREIIESYLS